MSVMDCHDENGTQYVAMTLIKKGDPILISQLVINFIGIIGNGLLSVLLGRHSLGGRLPTILFRTQAIFDLAVNLESVIFGLKGELWNVSVDWINMLICKLWHSQFIFWFSVQLSIGNLVLVGLERFLAISFPMVYQGFRPTKVATCWIVGNILYNVIMAAPNILEASVVDGCCKSQLQAHTKDLMLRVYSVLWFVFIYLLALILLIIFYGGVISSLKHSLLFYRTNGRSRATMRFTRMAIVITGIYIACISYDAVSYLIGRNGHVSYAYNTLSHKLGMLLVSLNSFANPCIYYLFVLRDSCYDKCKRYGIRMRPKHPEIRLSHQTNFVRSKSASSIS